jgi:hypothetical protein
MQIKFQAALKKKIYSYTINYLVNFKYILSRGLEVRKAWSFDSKVFSAPWVNLSLDRWTSLEKYIWSELTNFY